MEKLSPKLSDIHNLCLYLFNRNSDSMRKLYTVACLAMIGLGAKAQETLPYYQQYLSDGEFLFNPAQYGKTDDFHVNLNYQKQFANFSQSPNVQSIGMHANVYDRLGVGMSFFKDANGPISAGGATLGASYFIPLSDEGERKDQFSFGTSISAYNANYDYSKINVQQAHDALLTGENSIFLMYANFGLAASYKNWFAGASVNDIALSNNQAITNNVEPSPIKIFLNLGYNLHLSENVYITPSAMANLDTNSRIMLDGNLMGTLKTDFNAFSLGANFRYVQNRFDNQSLAIAPVLKVSLDKFTVSAIYNIGLSQIQQYGGNSFMIGLSYNFQNFLNPRGFRY